MKRNNKKGFTITELVIVIAVIAILAAVLIPTFSGVIDKAKKSAADQEVRAALTTMVTNDDDATLNEGEYLFYHIDADLWYKYSDGKLVDYKGAVPTAGSVAKYFANSSVNMHLDTAGIPAETLAKMKVVYGDLSDSIIVYLIEA